LEDVLHDRQNTHAELVEHLMEAKARTPQT
jgi:hypothetical protein